MSTIKDVAALAGVSVSTVSILLNGKAKDRKISLDTQNKVAEAIKTLNYRPNMSAKKLRSTTDKEYTIGVYWASDFRTNFLARLITGIQSEIIAYPFPINIVICPYQNGYLHREKGLQSGNTFNAAIIANTSTADMDYLESQAPQIPFVLYNRHSDHYNTVTIDNYDAGRKAAMLFINKGITDIGAVLYKESYLAMGIRSRGFIETCAKHNVHITPEKIITTENSILGGVMAAEKFLLLNHRPKAVFCDTDSIAQGMLHVLNKSQIKVPQDLALVAIGMGSSEANKYSTPPLTVVEIPIEKISAECVKLIISVLEHQVDPPQHVHCNSELILRESCCQPS
jgi:LacI family purine nucleotide synthesis repressor